MEVSDKQYVRSSWNYVPSLILTACYSLCYFVIHTPWNQNHENKPKQMGKKIVFFLAYDAIFLFIGILEAAKFWCHYSYFITW